MRCDETSRNDTAQAGYIRLACVKLDIEGGEIEVLQSIEPRELSPQWTVEFHDDPQFHLCDSNEVDAAMITMAKAGFGVLIRNWPSRDNVLFLDRRRLAISWVTWPGFKLRYQYLALFWRKLRGLR